MLKTPREYLMLKKIIFSVCFSFVIFRFANAMELDAYQKYGLSIKKFPDLDNAFQIKIRKQPKTFNVPLDLLNSMEKCSLVANFATQTCDNQQNLFAPFNTAPALKRAVFGDASTPDCFLWNIPDFGLLKIQPDGTVFFGHGPEDVPLAHTDVTFKSSGKLFLGTLKVAQLILKSKESQLCQAVVADHLIADHCVQNKGGLKVKQLSGTGEFLNEGALDFEGNQQDPAILGIKNFVNKKGARFNASGLLLIKPFKLEGASSFINTGELKCEQLELHRQAINKGFWQANRMTVKKQPFINKEFGQVKILDGLCVESSMVNAGDLTLQGEINLTSAKVQNKGTVIWRNGNLSCANTTLSNAGNWLMDSIKSSGSLDLINDGTFQLKDSSLRFNQLTNNKDLLLYSGVYAVYALKNKLLQFLENDWTITDDPTNASPNRFKLPSWTLLEANTLGEIESQKNLLYDINILPNRLCAQGDICCSNQHIRDINHLNQIQTPGKVTAWCKPIDLIKESGVSSTNIDFSKIGHLELFVNGPFTTHYSFKAPTLSLHVAGPLILGKDNENLGTIAATHGPLTVTAHAVDGRYGKFYGKGQTILESTKGDITIGAEARGIDENIKQQYMAAAFPDCRMNIMKRLRDTFDYTLDVMNGAYAASDNTLSLKSAANIFITFGALLSALKNNLIAQNEIQNLSGRISSQGTTSIQGAAYNHVRKGAVTKTKNYQYPGSGPAVLESLGKIDFAVKTIKNIASSIRSGQGISFNNGSLSKEAGYIEEPQTFFHNYFNGSGRGTEWGPKSRVLLNQSCTTQSGDVIQMNLGNFVITGSMNAETISIHANSGLFANNNHSRQTLHANQPLIVDVTAYMQEQAQRPGILRLGTNNAVQTEFPLGAASAPQEGDVVLLENPARPTPLQWRNIFNPLNSINLDLHLQQLLANLAGKVYAGKAKGNKLATILWANANKWRQQHGKETMFQSELQSVNSSMLLSQILYDGLTPQQQTLLCVAPGDINPYQDQGDIVADTFECVTEGDQTHLNNRIVTHGPEGITIKSVAGNVNLETQSYTVSSETKECKVIQQRAMPQQQLIADAGPIKVIAQGNLSRTGSLIAAAGDVDEHAQTGSVIKNPLVLQTIVENRHKEKGFFSTTESTQTSLTHQVAPSTTISGEKLHEKGAVSINSIAPQDCAGQEICYESPNTNIEGLIVANRTTTHSQTSGPFSEQSTFESKETPCATPATMQAPLIRLMGKNARVNANITAKELHDETEHGAQFVAKVAQMLCSGQTLASSPLMSADVGYNAGYEAMIAPMLMAEKIIRAKDSGHMLFESALIDKNRTKIIGKFVETTYQLKQWQTSWNHTTQVIPNEALVVIAFAIVLATQGMGVEALAPLLKSVTAATGMQLSTAGIAMVNAGFSTICSSAGTSFLRTGDPINTIQQLTSPAQLKSVAFSMASAGLCSQLGDMLKVNMNPELKSLASHLQEQALRGTVDTLLNIAINHAPVDKALGDACKQIPLKAAAAYAANKICTAYMDTISQKAAQALVGGLSGFALDQSPQGFISGAMGALTAEIIGDYLISDAKEISAIALERLKCAGKPLTIENMQQAILEEVRFKMNFAKVASSSFAALIKQDPSIAFAAASNAIDNDITIRGSLYALAEFQAMVLSASQTLATLDMHGETRGAQSAEDLSANSPNEQTNAMQEADRRPFVENPNAGIWYKACISGDLVLMKGRGKYLYLGLRSMWHKHPKCPFNVYGHGNSSLVEVGTEKIHPQGLNRETQDILKAEGNVNLNAVELAQLIRTAPNYKEGQHINLFSCECGADSNGIAQRLADEMKVPVSAFTGKAASFGLVFASVSFDNWLPQLKEIKTFYPQEKPITNIPLDILH